MPNPVYFRELRNTILPTIQSIGVALREKRESNDTLRIEEKGLHNLVSEADQWAETQLVEALLKVFPGSGIQAEEGSSHTSENGYNWIIDPIDGTTNYVHNLPCYAISVALYREEQPVIGVVYDITRDEMYHTSIDQQAFCNKKEIHVSPQTSLFQSLLATGFPYEEDQLDAFLAIYKHLLRHSRGVRRLGSAALDLAYVAAGRFEGFYETGLQPWDVAAGAFLVHQAGGNVTSFAGGTDFIADRTLLASNGAIHTELQAVLSEHLG